MGKSSQNTRMWLAISLEISKFRVFGRIIRILEEGQGAQEFVAPRPLNLKKKNASETYKKNRHDA